ncbi:hypothetical protein [Streptomyces sp. cg35]|uniref:hypothetical protein n=1 Tax=Streptomyces sp. cg35 TaxID=3421650 RepID=UPI003D16A28B
MPLSEHERRLLLTGTLDTSGVGGSPYAELPAVAVAFGTADEPEPVALPEPEPEAVVEPEPEKKTEDSEAKPEPEKTARTRKRAPAAKS